MAFNHKKGTLRGMHFQFPPSAETKLVRATRGAILDIIVDLRPESPTYMQHIAVELNEDNSRALYVPERFAHGYQVLVDKTETSYQVGEFYTPGVEGGLMYNDPRLGLKWPLPVAVISDKDQTWKTLAEQEAELKRRMGVDQPEPVRQRVEKVTELLTSQDRKNVIMIIVDNALKAREAEGRPIRVALLGAGFMSLGLANHIVNTMQGMRLVGVYNRRVQRAADLCEYAGIKNVAAPQNQKEADLAMREGKTVITDDAFVLAKSPGVDVLVDVTGSVEFGARVAFEAFKNGKDVVLLNAEIDATIGPILQTYADKHGVILSACDGDEPGLASQSLPLGQGLGPDAARDRQRQRIAGSISQSDYAEGLRGKVEAESCDGHQLCRWFEDQLRASDRRQCHRLQGAVRAACRAAWNTRTTS